MVGPRRRFGADAKAAAPESPGGNRAPSGPDQSKASRSKDDRPKRATSSRDEAPRVPAGPPVDRDVDLDELDPALRTALRTLSAGAAETVGGHLVMVARMIDEDTALASSHAEAAAARAGRVGAVREIAGLTAYRNGDFGAALRHLQAARRMGGGPDFSAMIADSHRAAGKPERALEAIAEVDTAGLDPALQAELAIVAAGARRDRGQSDVARVLLEQAIAAHPKSGPWTPRLQYAYGDLLADLGDIELARNAFSRAAATDEGSTDAPDRLAALVDSPGE